jgi:iron complex outermembrane recepter protein
MDLRVYGVTWYEGSLTRALIGIALALAASAAAATEPLVLAESAPGNSVPVQFAPIQFKIPAGRLSDSLDRFSEQSGLQVIYEPEVTKGRDAREVEGSMLPAKALAQLLPRHGVQWTFVNSKTVFIRYHAVAPASTATLKVARAPAAVVSAEDITELGEIQVLADPRRVLPSEASTSAFGFSKSLLDTPRAVSFISEESIGLFGLSAVEDLVRVVPGAFTTTRFGIQGSVDLRNVPADFYFRGMKRLSLQGHGRSVLAAMDTIEVVRGPPSPLFGMGKIGGYVNAVPTSGRAKSGAYLSSRQGFVQGIAGAYSRDEWSFGIGGPMALRGKQGGYYVYGLHEDSASFARGVPVRQDVLQAAISEDDFIGPFRLETGTNYQLSRTAGALTGRLTQELVDTGRYIRGTPLVNLDLNGNGAIGYLEMQSASPVRGTLSTGNQPLIQYFDWPKDANGKPLPIDQFPHVKGIPKSFYDYLVAHPEADPTGVLRAQGPGGPVPISGHVPIGMALDPRTIGYGTLDLHRAAAFERDLEAQFLTAFVDLVYDTDPNFTVRNQLFFDSMDQYKVSNQPFAQQQYVYVWEDKLTVTRRISRLPSWLRMESLASVNFRNTVANGHFFNAGDFSTHRTDAIAPTWSDSTAGMTPNTTFANPIDNPDLASDGYPWNNVYRSQFWELGAGVLLDMTLFDRTNVMVGGRLDGSQAQNTDLPFFNVNTGTSANPGAYVTAPVTARGWDRGTSWNASVSHTIGRMWKPYFTIARASIALDANNNALTNAVITSGHIGSATMREIGVKASGLGDRLFVSASAYDQSRTIAGDEDPAVINTYATATGTRGLELEVKWVPTSTFSTSFYALRQRTRFEPNAGGAILVDARTLGFQDVLDADGNVIYPAEAFMYGGRGRIVLPDGMDAFDTKQGNPETQLGMSGFWQLPGGFGFTLSGNYFSSTCSGRLCAVHLPSATVLNAGAFWERDAWQAKVDAMNLTDERWFRARSGDSLGDPLAQAMPDRRWQLTLRFSF